MAYTNKQQLAYQKARQEKKAKEKQDQADRGMVVKNLFELQFGWTTDKYRYSYI